jgi:hypothetical protein
LKSVVCFFILPYPVYFSIYYSCVYNAKMNLLVYPYVINLTIFNKFWIILIFTVTFLYGIYF